MRLLKVSIEGFESYKTEQTVPLEPHVTLLAGRNDVGKSAFLRALLAPAVEHSSTDGPKRARYEWLIPTESVREVLRGTVGADTTLKDVPDPLRFDVQFSGPIKHPGGDVVRMDVEGFGIAEGEPRTQIGWSTGPFQCTATKSSDFVELARSLMRRVVYIGPRRIDSGRMSLRADRTLTPEGRNLANVVFRLQVNEPKLFEQLAKGLRRAFPEIVSVRVEMDPDDNNVMGELVVQYERDEAVPLTSCGTGIEQFLAVSLAVLTAPSGRLIMIDEPQAYLHPHAERSLLSLLEEHQEHQFLIATHSAQLLNASPLSASRVVTIADRASRIFVPANALEVLDELEIRPSDLWLAERLIWVEGPSEERILGRVAADALSPTENAGLAIRAMPIAASRFSASGKRAESAYRFVDSVSRALIPLPLEMTFLFDRDEKSSEERDRIQTASGGRAIFLDRREIENFLLDARVIQRVLIQLDSDQGSTFSEETLQKRIETELAATDDTALYPSGPPEAGGELDQVRGSEVLARIWWQCLNSQYDKVAHGDLLSEQALLIESNSLDPLIDVVKP